MFVSIRYESDTKCTVRDGYCLNWLMIYLFTLMQHTTQQVIMMMRKVTLQNIRFKFWIHCSKTNRQSSHWLPSECVECLSYDVQEWWNSRRKKCIVGVRNSYRQAERINITAGWFLEYFSFHSFVGGSILRT